MKAHYTFSLALLAGCGALQPLPVAEFSSNEQFNQAVDQKLPFGDLNSFQKVQDAFVAYHNLYTAEARRKRQAAQNVNETSFYSSILGVLGGLAKSLEAAATGAVGAAGAGLMSDRYKLAVQASNYELAADALLCMYHLLPGATDEVLSSFRFVDRDSPADIELREIALNGLLGVRSKLGRLQSSFELGRPDPNRLKEALLQTKDKAADTRDAASIRSAARQRIPSAEEIAGYRAAVKACDSKIAG